MNEVQDQKVAATVADEIARAAHIRKHDNPWMTMDLYKARGAREAFERGDMIEVRALLECASHAFFVR